MIASSVLFNGAIANRKRMSLEKLLFKDAAVGGDCRPMFGYADVRRLTLTCDQFGMLQLK